MFNIQAVVVFTVILSAQSLWLVSAGTTAEVVDCAPAHNQHRRMHGAPDLKTSHELEANAEKHAQSLAGKEVLIRSESKFGENIFVVSGPNATCDDAVKYWYKKGDKHDYKSADPNEETLSFSQLIWKDSKQVGCALAKKDDKNIIVCNYSPAGNVKTKFLENVRPRSK